MKIKIITYAIVCILIMMNAIIFENNESVEVLTSVDTNSRAAIVYDRKYKKVLYGKNIDKKLPNASTTKILTAIVAFENGNMDDIVNVSKNAANVSGSKIHLRKNDKISMNDLMCGMLLCSGNDAAIAIAEHISGSSYEFCKLMNDKAREIGAYNTNFTSPHGLDDENHYSTAYDLAIITDYALDIPYIANIVKNKKMTININNHSRQIFTTNEMLSLYSGSNGVKTGYTGDAGRCLITSATKDEWQLISVVLGADTKKLRTNDSIKILNYGFEEYEIVDLCENMKKEIKINVEKSICKEYILKLNQTYFEPLKNGEKDNLIYEYNISRNLIAPIGEGTKIGEILIKSGENLLKIVDIELENGIDRKNTFNYIVNLTRFLLIFSNDCSKINL